MARPAPPEIQILKSTQVYARIHKKLLSFGWNVLTFFGTPMTPLCTGAHPLSKDRTYAEPQSITPEGFEGSPFALSGI
jgi:hypothetical protein